MTAGMSFVFIAAGFSAMNLGVLGFIGDSVPQTRESEYIGLRATAAGVGGVIGPTVVGVTAMLAGYQIAFTLMGLIALVAAIIMHRTLTEPERRRRVQEEHHEVETRPSLTQFPGQQHEMDTRPDDR